MVQMGKCVKCGADVESSQRFCPACGFKQERRCPKCGAVVAADNKFCGACGGPLCEGGKAGNANAPGEPCASGSTVGGHAVVGGDVTSTVTSNDSHNVSNNVSNTTYVTQSDETKKVVWCEVCGKALTVVETYRCPKCGKSVCARHYDETARMCVACRDADGKSQTPTGQRVCWLERASAAGDAEAQYELSSLYEKGEGVPKDASRAVELAIASARGSFWRGCWQTGWYYEHGVEGVLPVDKKEALKWYRRVVEILPGKKCLVEDAIRRLS